jgi:hypothetical protein
MVAENGGWQRSGSLDKEISVIRRLSWWFGRHCWEERWPESKKMKERQLAADEAMVREKEERVAEGWRGEKKNGNRGMAGFFVLFGPKLLPPVAMKWTLIYRMWKRDILSLMVPNRGLWFGWDGSHLLIQSVHRELPNLQEKVVCVGRFRLTPRPVSC